jgi:hypothetical protein
MGKKTGDGVPGIAKGDGVPGNAKGEGAPQPSHVGPSSSAPSHVGSVGHAAVKGTRRMRRSASFAIIGARSVGERERGRERREWEGEREREGERKRETE